jgi:SAM-dependent methyltransferase
MSSYYEAVYDPVYDPYSGKDYKSESRRLLKYVRRHKKSDGKSLLDVPCGTGRHLHYLKAWFDVEGLDINPRTVAIARKWNAGVKFHCGNMLTFKLPRRFDVITCLFSAIGYMTTVAQLRRAVRNMSLHLKPGGVLAVEPWVTPRNFKSGTLHAVLVNQPRLKLARIGRASTRGRTSIINFHYLLVTPKTIRYFRASERLGLFTHSEYLASFRAAGLKVTYYINGLSGRGLYVGVKA